MAEECIFCKIVAGKVPVDKIYENDNFFCFPDQNQDFAKGHSLVIPKKHFVNIMDMPATLGTEMIEAIKATADYCMKQDKTIEGFNLLMNNFPIAGQAVMHAHIHLFPRRKGDGIKLYE